MNSARNSGFSLVGTMAVCLKTFPTHQRMEDWGVWEQTQIRHAQELGLGIEGPHSLELEIHHLQAPSPELQSRLEEMQKLIFAHSLS